MPLGYDLKALNVINNLGLWMASKTPSHELRALDAITRSRLKMK